MEIDSPPSSGGQKSVTKVLAGLCSLGRLGGTIHSWPPLASLVAPDIAWSVASLLQSLPLGSHYVLFVLCVSLIRAFVIKFRTLSDNPHLEIFNFIISVKTHFPSKAIVPGFRD